MNFYEKYIVPRFINSTMRNDDLLRCRAEVISDLSGIGLEIGFGPGLNLPYYGKIDKLYALEPSGELFRIARKKFPKVSFPIEHLEVSAEKIPLADNSLDFVVSTWVMCSIPSPHIALREIFRVLKNGGRFVFVEHGKSENSLVAKIQNILNPFSKALRGGCNINRDIERLILDTGFDIQKIEKTSRESKSLGFRYKGVAVVCK